MGLCASKESPSQSTSSSSDARPVQRTGHQKKSDTAAKVSGTTQRNKSKKKLGGDEVLGEETQKISAKEAARLAAEKRYQDAHQKNTKGELGKKLEQERAKSHKSKMMEEAEMRQAERERLEWD